jgi:hypothetical protein
MKNPEGFSLQQEEVLRALEILWNFRAAHRPKVLFPP